MKKIGFLILFTLIVQGCNSQSSTEKTEHTSIPAIQTGAMQVEEPRTDNPNIPNCEPLDLKPLSPEEIIKIDDVVQNCKYEKGKNIYRTTGGGGRYPIFILFDQNILSPLDMLPLGTPAKCYSNLVNSAMGFSTGFHSDIINIVKKYNLQKKRLIEVIRPTKEQINYNCTNKQLCKQLEGKAGGETDGNYFVYGLRNLKDRSQFVFVINDKIYSAGEIETLKETTTLFKQGAWNIKSLYANKAIVNRYIEGELIEPYKSNPSLLDTLRDGTIIGRFKIQTCEIPLIEKSP